MDNDKQQQVQALAALIGTTNAELKQIDSTIVSSSTNLQQSKDAWNPESILSKGIKDTGQSLPVHHEPAALAIQQQQVPMVPVAQQGYIQPMPVQAHITLPPNIEDRLGKIEEALQQMATQLEKFTALEAKVGKFIQKGLDGRVKQITLKLDDSQNTK